MPCSVNTAEWDVTVTVDVRSDASICVNEMPTSLADLSQAVERAACGKLVRVEIRVWPPDSEQETFLDEVHAVQTQVRRVRGAVLIGYRSV